MDLKSLSNEDLLSLARQLSDVKASEKRVNPLALDSPQLHALSGSVLEGFPVVGPAMRSGAQRLGAAIDVAGGAPSYAGALQRREGAFNEAVSANPGSALAGNLVGGVAGTAPLVAAAPAAFGVGAGRPLLGRSAASMLTGGALGASDAAVRSGADPTVTAVGAGVGAGLGVAAPGVGGAIGRGAANLADRALGVSSPTGPLTGISRGAANYAVDAFGNPAQRQSIVGEVSRLGPHATLADVSPEWMGVARGAASRPGMRDAVVNPLLSRDASKNARLATDLDTQLGRRVIPSEVEGTIKEAQKALSPLYENAFANARAVDTTKLAERLEVQAINLRGPERLAVKQVRDLLNIPDTPPGQQAVLDPHPEALFHTRQAIDGLLAGEGNPKVIRQLTIARKAVDSELERAVPGIKKVDAQYERLAKQREALEAGGSLLDGGKTALRPEEVAAKLGKYSPEEWSRAQQGTRAEIDRIVGQNANDPLAMQRLVKSEGDWNRDKLRMIFGRDRADSALEAIDRETTFGVTKNRVTGGSDTAMAGRFGDFIDNAAKPNAVPTDVTLTGLAARGAQKLVQKILGTNSEAKAARFAEELGRLSVAQGTERDALIKSLLEMATKREGLEPISAATSKALRTLIVGAIPKASASVPTSK